MLFVTEKKVQLVIDRLLRASEGLAPSIKGIIDHPRRVSDTPAGKAATEIIVDATLLHQDILSLFGQFRVKAIPTKAAYFETEGLQRRLDTLTRDATRWTRENRLEGSVG